jgi:copper chaperone CopZ
VTVQHLSTYRVERMTGPHAVRAISEQLSALSGVRDVHIALDRGEVTVLSDHPLSQESSRQQST